MAVNGNGGPNKLITDYDALERVVRGFQAVNRKVVLTIGSWDLLHIGHVRYLLKARGEGDVLVVGVDTDRAIKLYKGPLRPVVPQDERCEMLGYQGCVDFVTLIDDVDKRGEWQYELVKKLKPDVFVAVEDSYPKEQFDEIQKYAKRIVVLPRQAENTSTTKMVQIAVKKHLEKMNEFLEKDL